MSDVNSRIRKHHIGLDSIPKDFDLEGSVHAALEQDNIRTTIGRISKDLGFRKYYETNNTHDDRVISEAISTFFPDHEIDKVSGYLAEHAQNHFNDSDITAAIKNHRCFPMILDAVVDRLKERFSGIPTLTITKCTSEIIVDDTIKAAILLDKSKPFDVLQNKDVTLAYIPGLQVAADMESTMTDFWQEAVYSTSLSIKPDNALANFLKLANMSVNGWLEAVEAVHGVRLDETDEFADDWEQDRAKAWQQFNVVVDASAELLVDATDLIHAVDSCVFGFSPMVIFKAPATDVLSLSWEQPLLITGGILGLHDFKNGHGDPICFDGSITIHPATTEIKVADLMENDLMSVHGLFASSFFSSVEELGPSSQSNFSI